MSLLSPLRFFSSQLSVSFGLSTQQFIGFQVLLDALALLKRQHLPVACILHALRLAELLPAPAFTTTTGRIVTCTNAITVSLAMVNDIPTFLTGIFRLGVVEVHCCG